LNDARRRNEELEAELKLFDNVEKRFIDLEEGFKLFGKVEKRNIDLVHKVWKN